MGEEDFVDSGKFYSIMMYVITLCFFALIFLTTIYPVIVMEKEIKNNEKVYGLSLSNDEVECYQRCKADYYYSSSTMFRNRVCDCLGGD